MKKFLHDFYHPRTSVIALGIGAALYFGILQSVWAVTGEFTRWGGHILDFLGYPTENLSYLKIVKMDGTPLTRSDGWVVWGMFLGALIAALAGENFKIRVPVQRRRLVQGLVGGFIAGFGARMAMGCNLAAMFTGVPQFTFHAMLFTAGTVAGTWIGLKITLMPLFLGKPNISKQSGNLLAGTSSNSSQKRYSLIVAVLSLSLMLIFFFNNMPKLGWALLFGISFGWFIQKGQVCFTSAFRDLWITGRSTILKALVIGMAVQTIGTSWFISQGVPAKVMWAGPGAVFGGLLFGIGIVIAGGCETGWMYRAMEGQTQFWMVGIGNIIGATVLTILWDQGIFTNFSQNWEKVDFVKNFGWAGAIVTVYSFLAALYLFAVVVEKRKKFKSLVKLPIDENIFKKGDEHGKS